MHHQHSLFAYKGIALSERQREVLEVFADGEEYTDKEVAETLGWEINRVTGRVKELIDAERIEEVGTEYVGGRPRRVCRKIF